MAGCVALDVSLGSFLSGVPVLRIPTACSSGFPRYEGGVCRSLTTVVVSLSPGSPTGLAL